MPIEDEDIVQGLDDESTDDVEEPQGQDDSEVEQPEEDGGDPFDVFRDPRYLELKAIDPNQADSYLQEQIRRFESNRSKVTNRRLRELAEAKKEARVVQENFAKLGDAFAKLQQDHPDLYARVQTALGGSGTPSKSAKKPEIKTFDDLSNWISSMIEEKVGSVKGEFVAQQQGEKLSKFLKSTPAARDDRERILELMAAANLEPENAWAAVNPKAYAKAKAKRAASAGGDRTSVGRVPSPASTKPASSFEDAFKTAINR